VGYIRRSCLHDYIQEYKLSTMMTDVVI